MGRFRWVPSPPASVITIQEEEMTTKKKWIWGITVAVLLGFFTVNLAVAEDSRYILGLWQLGSLSIEFRQDK